MVEGPAGMGRAMRPSSTVEVGGDGGSVAVIVQVG